MPYDAPPLELRDTTYGLVSPQEFSLPPPSPLWTPVAFAAFDVSRVAGAGTDTVSGQVRYRRPGLTGAPLYSDDADLRIV